MNLYIYIYLYAVLEREKDYKEDGGGAVRKVWREVSAGTSGRRQYDVRSLPPPLPRPRHRTRQRGCTRVSPVD